MGNLPSPITSKVSEDVQNGNLSYGVSSMQGWRDTFEDAHNCILHFDEDTSFFGVYDGHTDGADVAIYTSEKLPEFVKNNEHYKGGWYEKALTSAFLDFDDSLKSKEAAYRLDKLGRIAHKKDRIAMRSVSDYGVHSFEIEPPDFEDDIPVLNRGCAAVVALIRKDTLYVANAGDSRCVISRNGEAIAMSEDHKPNNTLEHERIKKAGGKVDWENRINGDISLSRALGDHIFKTNSNASNLEQLVIALPDVRIRKLDAETEFIVLACDGVWDCMSNQEVVDFIRPRIKSNQKLSSICEELFDKNLSPKACYSRSETGCDNMTCLIIQLRRGNTNNVKTTRPMFKNLTTSGIEATPHGKPTLGVIGHFEDGKNYFNKSMNSLA